MKTELIKENVEKALQDGAKSMSELYRALGGKTKASSSFSSKIRSFCTNVDAVLAWLIPSTISPYNRE